MSESYLAAAAKRSADSAASTSTDAQANEQEEKEQEEPTFHEKIRAILEAKDLTAAQDAIMRDPDIGRNKHIIIDTLPPGQWGKMDWLGRLAALQAGFPDDATMKAQAAERKAATKAKLLAEQEAFKSELRAAGFASEEEVKSAITRNPHDPRVYKFLTLDQAISARVCSGILAGYDCPVDRWGYCTGCREHG